MLAKAPAKTALPPDVTVGPSRLTSSPHPSSREGHLSTARFRQTIASGAAADAQNGHRRAWAEAAHHEVCAGAQDIPISFARSDHRPSEPGMVRRHHLSPLCRGFLYLVAIINWASIGAIAQAIGRPKSDDLARTLRQ
jgi:hypothetical protein